MSLLSIEHVSKRYRRGRREYVALRDVSLRIEHGEHVVALGTRKSGRSTLLRIAAGLERPDEGFVRFKGADLASAPDLVGRRIAYCRTAFSAMEGETIAEHVMAGLLAQRFAPVAARRMAERALERTDAAGCAGMAPVELDGAEVLRVALARSLASGPDLLVVDDPMAGVGLLQSGPLLRLLHAIAGEGVAVLMSTDDATCLSGADRAVSLDGGRLRVDTQPPQADVVPLRPVAARPDSEPGAGVGR